jgi:hypothetical protein
MDKFALFAFNGEPSCFIHVLLNALDLQQRGHEARIVIEGAAVRLIPEISRNGAPLFPLYRRAREQNLIHGACRACSAKGNVLHAAEEDGLALLDDMSGHPSMGLFLEQGYQIITF